MDDGHAAFLNFDKICRVCLTETAEMRSLDKGIIELIQICGDVEVNLLDGLPSIICIECLEKAQNAFSFRQQCKRSDNLLRELGRSNTEQTYFLVQCNNSLYLASDNNTLLERPRSLEMPALMPLSETSNQLELEAVDAINQALQVELDRRNNTDKHSNEIIEFLNDRIPEINEDLAEEYMQMINTHIEDPGLIDDATSVEVLSEPTNATTPFPTTETTVTVISSSIANSTGGKDIKQIGPPLPSIFFTCNVCNKQMKTKRSFLQHLKRHNTNLNTPPSSSTTDLINAPELITDPPVLTTAKAATRKYSCEVCGKYFGERTKLNVHMKIHLGVKEHECDLCNKKFTLPWQLKTHTKTHLNQRDFLCPYCNRAFGQKINLQNHIKSFHTFEKNFRCTYVDCDKAFVTSNELNKHLRKHRGEKLPPRVFCSVCNKGCSDSGQLKVHMRSHTKEKPYSCTICSKSYILHSHLVVHLRAHSNTRPYQCGQCTKSFYTSALRNKHATIHARTKEEIQKINENRPKRKTENDMHIFDLPV